MNQEDLCSIIAEKYYTEIYNYCYVRLNCDMNAAQDCTQDVFFIMIQKKNHLNLGGNIRSWLYRTANRTIKHYWRKMQKQYKRVSIDDIDLSDDGGLSSLDEGNQFSALTEDEYLLISEYYNTEYGHRNHLAQTHNMTLYELYKEIDRIKKKIKSST